MILYFADRQLNIIGQASTELPGGFTITEDKKTEDIETGVAIFECKLPYNNKTRQTVETCAEVGNYVLRSHNGDNEFYTIIESEIDTGDQTVYIYAEDDGMDLLNDIAGPYEADQAYPIEHYITKYAESAGFEIGINEAKDLSRKLSWDGESTAAERIASIATQFDGCEVSYSFDVKGLMVTKKYINIYKRRGKDIGVTLRLNEDVDSIVTSKSIANLATALECTGGTPEDEDTSDDKEPVPITLEGYEYDDGDFYVDGTLLKSREALKRWSRYLWKTDEKEKSGGHIIKLFSYDTTSQQELCANAVTELKKAREMEINYEVEITRFPKNARIGDRVNIVDNDGNLYVSARILKLETCATENEYTATLGEYLIKTSGISQKVAELASQFVENSQSAARALSIANTAKNLANQASDQAGDALQSAVDAQTAADAAGEAVQITAQELTDQMDEKLTEQETNITAATTDAILSALESYVPTVDFDEFRQTVRTELELMADQIVINFTTTTENLNGLDGEMQDRFSEWSKYIRFSADGITIGADESALTLKLDNEQIQFVKNGVPIGWWDGVEFHTGNLVVEVNERARFGDFAFVPRSDGSLMFLKVGGE